MTYWKQKQTFAVIIWYTKKLLFAYQKDTSAPRKQNRLIIYNINDMEYKDMIRDAKANGVASDKAMWQSVDTLSGRILAVYAQAALHTVWQPLR